MTNFKIVNSDGTLAESSLYDHHEYKKGGGNGGGDGMLQRVKDLEKDVQSMNCLLYTSPSPRDS